MGRAEWFEKQIDELYPRLHRSMTAYLAGTPVEADDILQETFLTAYKKIEQFNFESDIYTWLYTIARNRCIDEFRKQKHDQKRSNRSVDEIQIAAESGAEDEQSEDLQMLRKAIAELPELLRSIVVMKTIDGLSYPEISTITGVNEQTLKNRMFRARKELAESLKEKGIKRV
jgi:RNA polymerase sigma-70 factor (ECF subfamily)